MLKKLRFLVTSASVWTTNENDIRLRAEYDDEIQTLTCVKTSKLGTFKCLCRSRMTCVRPASCFDKNGFELIPLGLGYINVTMYSGS